MHSHPGDAMILPPIGGIQLPYVFREGLLMLKAIYCAVVFALLAVASQASANLIANGSFEAPVVPNASFTNFPGGSTAITDWTIVGVDSAVVDSDFTQSGITFQAQDGQQWVDLAGVTSNSSSSGVTQNIPTTPGQEYLISFYVGSATDNHFFFPTTVDLSINGGPRVPFLNPIAPANMLNWQQFLVPFVATSGTTNLTFYNGGTSSNFLNALDNVSVDAVPEPSAVALLLTAAIFAPLRRAQ